MGLVRGHGDQVLRLDEWLVVGGIIPVHVLVR